MLTFAGLFTPIIVIFVALILINASIRILRQYERGVMFTLGRFSSIREPGLIFLWPYRV